MVLWALASTVGWSAPTWTERVADAEAIRPGVAGPVSWERTASAPVVDLVAPLGAGWVLTGTTELTAQGRPTNGQLELWNGRDNRTQWTSLRPPVPGAVWSVIETKPLVVAGRAKGKLLLMGMDLDTGVVSWTVEANHPTLERDGATVLIWRDDHLESIGLADGQTVWKVPTGKPERVRMHSGRVIVEGRQEVVAIESGWGSETWRVPGRWSAAPPTDPSLDLLFRPNAVQALDPYGEPTWNWSPEHPVVTTFSDQGRAAVVTREPETDRVSIVANGTVVGSFGLQGRTASELTPVNGVLVVTTEDELVAFSASDGAIAFRKPLPDPLLNRDRDADLDRIAVSDERLVVVRPERGVAGFVAADFTGGELLYAQPFVATGTDGRSLAARRKAERGTSEYERIRRVHERLAAQRWHDDPLRGDYLVRPFRTGRVQGFTLVDLVEGRRADLVTGPVWADLVTTGLDPMVGDVDPRGEVFVIADTPPDPAQWQRVKVGDAPVPAPSVRGISLAQVRFGDTPNPLIGLGERPPTASDDAAPGPGTPDATSSIDIDQLFLDNGGPSWSLCVREGIVEAQRPEVVQACLRTGVRLQEPNDRGLHALLLAADRNQLETVRLILDAGADPNVVGDVDARTAIERATDLEVKGLLAERGGKERSAGQKKKAMKSLLALAGLKKPNDAWCFHHAAQGRIDVLDYCLDKGRLVDYVDPGRGHVLHVAVDRGWSEHVRRVLAAGANPNVIDATGLTPRGRMDAIGTLTDDQQRAVQVLAAAGGL